MNFSESRILFCQDSSKHEKTFQNIFLRRLLKKHRKFELVDIIN